MPTQTSSPKTQTCTNPHLVVLCHLLPLHLLPLRQLRRLRHPLLSCARCIPSIVIQLVQGLAVKVGFVQVLGHLMDPGLPGTHGLLGLWTKASEKG
jgi:hypothetical protein